MRTGSTTACQTMSRIEGHGISAEIPPGWDAEIYVRPDGDAALPILHLGTFSLPAGRGDFGGGAVERMGSRDIFISFSEYGAESVGTPLFSSTALTPIPPDSFDTQALQRPIPPQCGWQRFATISGRAFCLYIVLGHHRLRSRLAAEAERVVEGFAVGSR